MKWKTFVSLLLLLTIVFLAGGVTGNQWASRNWKSKYFLYRADSGDNGNFEGVAPQLSFNAVLETRGDSNLDGEPDQWFIEAHNANTPYEQDLLLRFVDNDFDSIPDTLDVTLEGHSIRYRSQDDEKDGILDSQVFQIPNHNNRDGEWYLYHDLNLDGKIDTMVNVKNGNKELHYVNILMNNKWILTIMEKGGNWTDGFWIEDETGHPMNINFDYELGRWKR